MKSPIGNKEFCEEVVGKRVDESLKIVSAISALPKRHVALYLLRYQISRMDFIKRCTPLPSCCDALNRFDSGVQTAFGNILGREFSGNELDQNSAPLRHGGLGFRLAVETADEAYFASLLASRNLRQTLGDADTGELQGAMNRTNARLVTNDANPFAIPESHTEVCSQQSIGRRLAAAKAEVVFERSTHLMRARLNAYSAPGAGIWSNAVPSQTLDKNLTSHELSTTVCLQLGVDVYDEIGVCKFCGMVLDCGGLHALSCTAGGDISFRHNLVRDIIFHFCLRARLNPQLEKAGLLEDESIMVNLRRPADVLAEMRQGPASSRTERTAIDVKVINALGQGHLDATALSGLAAAERYRDEQLEHLNTASLCRDRGISYEPVVFTAQGGVEKHAESILSRVAASVAASEEASVSEVKAEMMQQISLCLARSVAKAIRRRRPAVPNSAHSVVRRQAVEAETLEAEDGFQYQ